MEENERSCMEIINEIISKYSNLKTGETSSRFEHGDRLVIETIEHFWQWFCENVKNERVRKCFLEASREDYYGVLDEIRSEYRKKCG